MNLEKRGKFPGIKLHLTKEECEAVIALNTLRRSLKKAEKARKNGAADGQALFEAAESAYHSDLRPWAKTILKLIADEIAADPTILAERSEAEIKAELEAEAEKCATKLAKIAAGEEWKTHD